MNKEQIQQKFEKILNKQGCKFWTDGQLKKTTKHLIKKDFIELMEFAFNLGLEVAADNADADITILSGDDDRLWLQPGHDYEVYVIKNSILQHKL